MPEVTNPMGGLRVEDRTAHDPVRSTPESRILEAISSVPPGEMRDLTHATAAPVDPDDLRTVLIDRLRETSVVAASGVPIVPTDKKAVKFPVLTGDVTSRARSATRLARTLARTPSRRRRRADERPCTTSDGGFGVEPDIAV